MPRCEFDSVSDLEKWIKELLDPSRYMIYITSHNELITIPKTSTRPIQYGYMMFSSSEELKKLVKTLEKHCEEKQKPQFMTFNMKRFVWGTDTTIGTKDRK